MMATFTNYINRYKLSFYGRWKRNRIAICY